MRIIMSYIIFHVVLLIFTYSYLQMASADPAVSSLVGKYFEPLEQGNTDFLGFMFSKLAEELPKNPLILSSALIGFLGVGVSAMQGGLGSGITQTAMFFAPALILYSMMVIVLYPVQTILTMYGFSNSIITWYMIISNIWLLLGVLEFMRG